MTSLLDKIKSGIAIMTPHPADDPKVIEAAADALAVRLAIRDMGHIPLPLYGEELPTRHNNWTGIGMSSWQNIKTVSDDLLVRWGINWPDAFNTGALTREMPTLDVDIRDEAAAQAVEKLVREQYEKRGKLLMRIGEPPKRAFPFRTEQPFDKKVIKFKSRGGEVEKLEFLCDGQQVVVDGVHPDNGKPYTWFGGELFAVARAELPPITEAEAKALMKQAAELLVGDFGYVRGKARTKPTK